MQNPDELQRVLATSEPPELGPEHRSGTWSEAQIRREVSTFLSSADPTIRDAITALVLLWHDHLEASHSISQGIDNPDGAFVHGIMHRREPDYGNAAYWFRRVGKHPAFGELADRVSPLLGRSDAAHLRERLLVGDSWQPFAFIDACEEARSSGAREDHEILRHVQRAEFECLLHSLAARA